MCLNHSGHFRIKLLIVLTTVLMITPFFMQAAQASMVIAPSTIVLNSNVDDGNEKNSRTNDTTIKAIISYASTPLASGSQLLLDSIDLFLVLERSNQTNEHVFIAPAVSIRYCFEDDNLIVEFNRDEVTDSLQEQELDVRGVITVLVSGAFKVQLASTDANSGFLDIQDDTYEVDETAQILLTNNPVKDR